MSNPTLPGFSPTDLERVREMSLSDRVDRAIALLRANEPGLKVGFGFQLYHRSEGYYLAFSGGKDSCTIKKLCQLAGVRFDPFYNQTTIDPPELIRFLKAEHPDVKWDIPQYGNMMVRVAEKSAAPPTRMMRWCCEEYKEHGGAGRVKVIGVRAAESANRAKNWREITKDQRGDTAICPIVYWSDEQLWEFIRAYQVPYCKLYDEGWKRLGCVGCPLNAQSRILEFKRWPAFERNWKKAVIANWMKWKDVPGKDGDPRFQSRFKSGEEFWAWWMKENREDVNREGCQRMLLWTNEPDEK